jgi:hypothetical protein
VTQNLVQNEEKLMQKALVRKEKQNHKLSGNKCQPLQETLP